MSRKVTLLEISKSPLLIGVADLQYTVSKLTKRTSNQIFKGALKLTEDGVPASCSFQPWVFLKLLR